MKNSLLDHPPMHLPVLTEVVQLPDQDTAPAGLMVLREVPQPSEPHLPEVTPANEAMPAAEHGASPERVFTEEALTQRVLADVDRQLNMMFEHRMREALGPAFARATESLLSELRHELALNLRDMVSRAVATEIARHGPSPYTVDP